MDLVARGEVELGIVRQLRDSRVRSLPLYEDELVLVARPDHPFAIAGAVDVAEISDAQLILFDRTSSYYDVTNALFRIAGVVPRGVTEVDNIEAAKRMVERGLGVALLPGTAIADSLSAGLLREIELAGTATIRRQIVAVERLGARPAWPFLTTLWGLLERIPELIPRALPTVAARLSRSASRAEPVHLRAPLDPTAGCHQDPHPGRGTTRRPQETIRTSSSSSSAVRRNVETSPQAGQTATDPPIRSSWPRAPANPHPQRSSTSNVSASSVVSAIVPPSVSIRNACRNAGSAMLEACRTRTSWTGRPAERRSHSLMSSATSDTSCMAVIRDRYESEPGGMVGDELRHRVDELRQGGLDHRRQPVAQDAPTPPQR